MRRERLKSTTQLYRRYATTRTRFLAVLLAEGEKVPGILQSGPCGRFGLDRQQPISSFYYEINLFPVEVRQ